MLSRFLEWLNSLNTSADGKSPASHEKSILDMTAEVGHLVLVPTGPHVWSRAQVTRVLDHGAVMVEFYDGGAQHYVPAQWLRKVPT